MFIRAPELTPYPLQGQRPNSAIVPRMDPTKIITLTISKRRDGGTHAFATSLEVDVPPNNERIRTAPLKSHITQFTLKPADLPAEHWSQIEQHVKNTTGMKNNDSLGEWCLFYDPRSKEWKDKR
jgi:hypothetical protein